MKLIFLLILGFLKLSLEDKQCEIFDYISKSRYTTSYNNGRGVYIDTSEFDGDDDIGIYVTVYDGYFKEFNIYYGSTSSKPQMGITPILSYYESSYSSSYSGYYTYDYYYTYYYHYTSYYKIPKPSERYLLIAIPDFIGSYVEIGHSTGFPVWAIAVIVVVVIIIIIAAVVIIIYYIRRRARIANTYVAPASNPGYYPPMNAYANNPSPAYTPPPAVVPSYPPAVPNYY